MAVWQIVLYAFASFLALRSLLSLMAQHRKEHRTRFLAIEQQRLAREGAADPKRPRVQAKDAA